MMENSKKDSLLMQMQIGQVTTSVENLLLDIYIKLAGGAVSWVSRKQKTVALSSTEAEYMCLSDTTRQIVWIKSLFKELNFDISNIALCGDNHSAIFLASNPAQEHRSKHIDIQYHYI